MICRISPSRLNPDSFRDLQKRATSSENAVYSDCWGTVNRDCRTDPPLLGEEGDWDYEFFGILPPIFCPSHSAFLLFRRAAESLKGALYVAHRGHTNHHVIRSFDLTNPSSVGTFRLADLTPPPVWGDSGRETSRLRGSAAE
jgi:hypothetical protein